MFFVKLQSKIYASFGYLGIVWMCVVYLIYYRRSIWRVPFTLNCLSVHTLAAIEPPSYERQEVKGRNKIKEIWLPLMDNGDWSSTGSVQFATRIDAFAFPSHPNCVEPHCVDRFSAECPLTRCSNGTKYKPNGKQFALPI